MSKVWGFFLKHEFIIMCLIYRYYRESSLGYKVRMMEKFPFFFVSSNMHFCHSRNYKDLTLRCMHMGGTKGPDPCCLCVNLASPPSLLQGEQIYRDTQL